MSGRLPFAPNQKTHRVGSKTKRQVSSPVGAGPRALR
jgi:hypothetical protein